MSTPNSLFQSDWGIPCKKQKLTPCSKDQKVDQFPTCSATAQSLCEREGFPAVSHSHSHLKSLSSNCSSSMELEIGATHPDQTLEPWFQSDTSTGYLQDAIAGRAIWCKQHNLPSCSKDQRVDEFPIFSSTTAQPLHDCGFTHQKRFITTNLSSSSPQGDTHEAAIKHDPARSSYASGQRKKIAYPFKLVKSGGVLEGETTLKDINNQILTTPSASKPIPHPVKDSVTNPYKLVRGSLGLSGKEVASFTRIHTRGRGSITIIRTKD